MKAAVQYGPGDVRVEDIPEPQPGPDEVKVKIEYCGVCGSDLEIFAGTFGLMKTDGWPKGPKIEGHEASGTIVALGSEVKQGYHVGQRVAMNFRSSCGACYYCRNMMEHFCEHVTMGSGAFAEYAVYKESAIYPLPDDVSFERGALLEPLTVALHVTDLAEIKTGSSVAISGGGTIGLLTIQMAARSGAAPLMVSEPVASKREFALRFGADAAVDPMSDDLVARGMELTQGRGFDTVIEASGNLRAATQALSLVGKCGTVVYAGELTIKSAMVSPYSFPRSVSLLPKLDLDPIVTHTYALRDIVEAFENHKEGHSIKTLIRP
jgi:2-desacetyl-2-hydroxyethyl bacteriochlorophyllide A dehydrogenase